MNVLITSVGRRSYMVEYFKKAIGGQGSIHVSNSSEINPSFVVADKSVVTPLIYDDNYIPFLLEYCKENKIDIILSLFDIDLYILSKNKEKFSEIGVKMIISNDDFIKICNDKWLTYCYLKELHFEAPQTYLDLQEGMKALKNGDISYPLILKPRWGMGSLSIYVVDNDEELLTLYKKIKKEIQTSYMKYESMQELGHSVLIQQKIDGQEYGLDIINDLDGQYINTIVKKKISMRSGETDCAEIVKDDNLLSVGKKLGSVTGHIANLDVDVLYDGKKAYILEMNARFGGGYPFSHIAGVNLPLAIIRWCKGEKVDNDILKPKKYILSHKDISIIKLK